MPLVVEDGTGLPNAESYCSVVEASAFHTARGNADWAAVASDTVREELLRKATDYMKQLYRLAWAGARKTSTQALDWPRVWVPIPDLSTRYYGSYYPAGYFSDSAVPQDVKDACAMLALKAISGDLLQDTDRLTKSESVGSISVTYADDGARKYPVYQAIDSLLAPWLENNGQGSVMRA